MTQSAPALMNNSTHPSGRGRPLGAQERRGVAAEPEERIDVSTQVRLAFAANLADAMKARGVSTMELAAALGLSRNTVMYWLAARSVPRLVDVVRAAQALETKAIYLVGDM